MDIQKTSVDWLEFRSQTNVVDSLSALRALYAATGLEPKIGKRGQLQLGRTIIGRVRQSDSAQGHWWRWVLSGRGCDQVTSWQSLAAVSELRGAEIRRIDVALTTVQGEATHEKVVAAHAAGRFTSRGRPPRLVTLQSTDPLAGRTCYVGKRGSDRFFRGYEKGLELLGRLGNEVVQTYYAGYRVEDIYRCEVEFKVQKHPIPWEIVEHRDRYFAGCYPFLADFLPEVQPSTIARRERGADATLASALRNCRAQYGSILLTAQEYFGGDTSQVWGRIVGERHSPKLVGSGVLDAVSVSLPGRNGSRTSRNTAAKR